MICSLKMKCYSLLTFMLIIAASCAQTPVRRYYTLENTGKSETAGHGAVCARPVTVASVEAASPYDLDSIVFRSGNLEVRYYNYRHWVSIPEEMLIKLISRRLESEGMFTAVESVVHASGNRLGLYVRLNSLEEVDGADGWQARMAMSFMLKNERSDEIIWKDGFDETRPVPEKKIRSVVQILNNIYNDQMKAMMKSLRKAIRISPTCKENAE